MPRKHKGGKKPKGPPPYLPHRPKRGMMFADSGGNVVRSAGYTMADEARNTAHNRRGGSAAVTRLRFRPVTFISAGVMDPLKDFEVKPKKSEATRPQISHEAAPGSKAHTPDPNVSESQHVSEFFTIDTTGDSSLRLDRQEPEPDLQTLDVDSDSSEDVILFKGRDPSRQLETKTQDRAQSSPASRPVSDPMLLQDLSREIQSVEKTVVTAKETMEKPELASGVHMENAARPRSSRVGENPKTDSTRESDFISISAPHLRKGRKFGDSDNEEAAIIADYIANMQDLDDEEDDSEENQHPGLGSNAFHFLRDLGGSDSDAVPRQYDSCDNASGDSNDNDKERPHQYNDGDLARLLAKQEELGLGGDELLLFDGADAAGNDDDWDLTPKPRRKRKGDSKTARLVKEKGQYPSATGMAAAFDDFDVMDWHHPSLKNFTNNNTKKKKGPPVFDVSDSELEEAMTLAWQKDRLKKADKKRAREELRSQGLLGKNVNPDDLRTKYRGGMSVDDLEDETELFIRSSREQLILPPFDKKARMVVHQIANRLKLKSQSAGKGNSRYPVLYRTKATLAFDQQTFDHVFGRIKQSWFPRVDVDDNTARDAKVLRRAEPRERQRGNRSLTYKEGDVVGENAKELGIDNRGRAMLEKMGWSKGMALGTEENKGIMVPIQQVVKKTKAGLGEV